MKYNIEDIPSILKKKYTKRIFYDYNGAYFAEIVEFPGCFASGFSPEEAFEILEEIAIDWLKSAIYQNQDIPDPIDITYGDDESFIKILDRFHNIIYFSNRRSSLKIDKITSSYLHFEFTNEMIESDMAGPSA